MKIIEVDKLLPYVKNSYPIGMGMTAICFKKSDNKVLKIFKKNEFSSHLIKEPNFLDKMIKIGNLTNDTFVGPDTILTYEGCVVGYLYPYVDAPLLAELSSKTKLKELFLNYDKLLIDTKKISDDGLRLFDLHCKNILFDDKFHIIDLDKSNFYDDKDFNYSLNMSELFKNIIYQIYNTKQDELPRFLNKDVELFLKKVDPCDLESINMFINYFSNLCDLNDPTVGDIKHKIKVKNEYNSYYKKN